MLIQDAAYVSRTSAISMPTAEDDNRMDVGVRGFQLARPVSKLSRRGRGGLRRAAGSRRTRPASAFAQQQSLRPARCRDPAATPAALSLRAPCLGLQPCSPRGVRARAGVLGLAAGTGPPRFLIGPLPPASVGLSSPGARRRIAIAAPVSPSSALLRPLSCCRSARASARGVVASRESLGRGSQPWSRSRMMGVVARWSGDVRWPARAGPNHYPNTVTFPWGCPRRADAKKSEGAGSCFLCGAVCLAQGLLRSSPCSK